MPTSFIRSMSQQHQGNQREDQMLELNTFSKVPADNFYNKGKRVGGKQTQVQAQKKMVTIECNVLNQVTFFSCPQKGCEREYRPS